MKDNLTIAAIQTELFWKDKQKNLLMFSSIIDKINQKIDIILLPEMFNTGFSINPELAELENEESMKFLNNKSKEKNAVIIATLMIKENDKIFNRLICMHPDGSYQKYDKKHLFILSDEANLLNSGEDRVILNIKDWKILPLICYDLRFPVWIKNNYEYDNYEYDLIINLANWPSSRSKAWRTLLAARAIENQSYVIGVNRIGKDGLNIEYSGDSMVIDMKGDIIYDSKNENEIFIENLNYEDLEIFRKSFQFAKNWDKFKLLTNGGS